MSHITQRLLSLCGSLRRPGLVNLLHYELGDVPYLVFESAASAPLPPGRLIPAQAVDIACQLLEVAHFLHQQGLVLGNMEPKHIWLFDENRVALCLAQIMVEDTLGQLTQVGSCLNEDDYRGVAYLSPDLVQGTRSASSDQYVLGVILYEMLTGQPPFGHADGSSLMTVPMKSLQEAPRRRASPRSWTASC